jgi:TonB family protein
MITKSFSTKYRSIANQRLTKTLLIGLGGSALLHTVAIAGVSYWERNQINDQINIVEIERVELEQKLTPSTKPTVKQTTPTPQSKVAKPPAIAPESNSMPVKVLIPPKVIKVTKVTKSALPVAGSTSPLSNIISSTVKPGSISAKPATTIPQKSNPSPPFPSKLFSNPSPKNALSQSEIEDRIKSPKLSPKLTQNTTQKNNNSTPLKVKQPQKTNTKIGLNSTNKPPKPALNPSKDPSENIPTPRELKPDTPANSSKLAQMPDRSIIPGNNQPKSPSGFSSGFGSIEPTTPPTKDNLGGTSGNNPQIANNIQTAVSMSNNHRVVPGNNDSNLPLTPSGSGLNSNGTGTGNGDTPGNIATGNNNQVSIQCLRNCEIRYPDELETSDIGKDKILVRVTIDPNGLVASAEIARSSGNQKLDQFTLDGIKQMQLNPTGKTRTHKIRISTLLKN